MNYLHEYDFKTLAERRYSIAYCPKSSAYFGHRKIDLTQLLDLDVNVCLGTDSLASNNTLDLRAEIRLAQKEHPHISSEQWLRMATVNAAKALGLDGQLGCIVPGAYADLMAFKCSVKNANPYESVLSSTAPPHFLLVNGETVLSDKM
jgi:cytosine/adenosine deaminase-related metal-dependent hydrolase